MIKFLKYYNFVMTSALSIAVILKVSKLKIGTLLIHILLTLLTIIIDDLAERHLRKIEEEENNMVKFLMEKRTFEETYGAFLLEEGKTLEELADEMGIELFEETEDENL